MDTKDPNRLPRITKALIEELEKRFPDRCPEGAFEAQKLGYTQGQQSIIRLLRAHHEWQKERN